MDTQNDNSAPSSGTAGDEPGLSTRREGRAAGRPVRRAAATAPREARTTAVKMPQPSATPVATGAAAATAVAASGAGGPLRATGSSGTAQPFEPAAGAGTSAAPAAGDAAAAAGATDPAGLAGATGAADPAGPAGAADPADAHSAGSAQQPATARFRTADSPVASDRLPEHGADEAVARLAGGAPDGSAGTPHGSAAGDTGLTGSAGAADVADDGDDAPQPPAPPEPLNREQGILAFNERVFAMAEMDHVPLLERLRYLTIVSANLDELFEIRVAELKELERTLPADRVVFRAQLEAIAQRASELIARQYALLNDVLTPALRAEGIVIHVSTEWTPQQRAWAETVFDEQVEPLLTPIALDPAHPFPRILNKNLSFAVELHGKDAFGRKPGIAVVQIPRLLPRVAAMPSSVSGHPHGIVLLTSLLYGFVDKLFPGLQVKGITQFRLTRNSDLDLDEEDMTDLRLALRSELGQRHYGDGVRLELSTNASPVVVERLKVEFALDDSDCYFVDGPVNLVRLGEMIDLIDRPDLKFPRHDPKVPAALQKKKDLFAAISRGDILVHHPYEAFAPVMDFLRSAAIDPQVVSIKQTIYRTGADSGLMLALMEAARAGKEVTAVVELMARFDEETNSKWAAQLEEVGAHVVYGVVGHKTHAKLALVIRRENGKLRRYAHLGTGNYHARTARLYEDFGLFTADEHICADVQEVFRRLTGLGTAGKLKFLLQAPFTLQSYLLESIRREADAARAGRPARITAKVNALLEESVIQALYDASRAGVTVELIVRGVCALRPGVPGLSDNIRVVSVLGRFLEHSRIYHFHAGGDDEVWLASADWMGRNLLRRVEVAFPIRDRRLKQRVIDEGLRVYLDDGRSVWTMDAQGVYRLEGDGPGSAQDPQRLLLEG